MRLQQLSKQVLEMLHLKKSESLYQEKLEFYEAVIEDITSENTTLVLRLDKVETSNDQLESSKAEMSLEIESFKQLAKKAAKEAKDLEHKLQVQHILRDQFKEFIKENMEVFDPNNAHLIKEKMGLEADMAMIQTSLLDPLSQLSQGPRDGPHQPMKSDTEYNNRMVEHSNFGARSVQSSITPALL